MVTWFLILHALIICPALLSSNGGCCCCSASAAWLAEYTVYILYILVVAYLRSILGPTKLSQSANTSLTDYCTACHPNSINPPIGVMKNTKIAKEMRTTEWRISSEVADVQ